MRRFVMSLAIAASLVAVSATTVLGHECFIFNRSAQGSIGADHSARWNRLTLARLGPSATWRNRPVRVRASWHKSKPSSTVTTC